MGEVLTLTGAPKSMARRRPAPRLDGCEIAARTRDGLVPINDCLLRLEAEMQRLLALMGSDLDEWAERVAEVAEKVGGKHEQ